jgi:hypothetical protein
MGFWLVNYHMAVNITDSEPPLVRTMYDNALNALASGAPFHEVLAGGASSAAVAREYGHRNNRYNNNTGEFFGNDDFARELHQLFFRINGVISIDDTIEDPNYHENTTIENTAKLLTGMQLDKQPNAYGTTLTNDWWIAPIDFTNHMDASGRTVNNVNRHHRADMEIHHRTIMGSPIPGFSTAEDKLNVLASIAIEHPESLENSPVAIITFFADDNLNATKIADIRQAWKDALADPNNNNRPTGQPEDLLNFLRAYAISTTFHDASTYKFRTTFHRNMAIYNLNTVDNLESYQNSFNPRGVMGDQGGDVFIPVHDVFGGQTSLNAANNPNIFKEAYNSVVNTPNRIAKIVQNCNDALGNPLMPQWRKDWAKILPITLVDNNGDDIYLVDTVGEWLWDHFIGDGLINYGLLERTHVNSFLATGLDLGYNADSVNPEIAYSTADLEAGAVSALRQSHKVSTLALRSTITAARRQANLRVGLAINFITATPYSFLIADVSAVVTPPTPDPTPVPDPNPVPNPEPDPATPAPTVEHKGTITATGSNQVTINGIIILITADTVIKFDRQGVTTMQIGQNVEMKGLQNTDGSITASKMSVKGGSADIGTPPTDPVPPPTAPTFPPTDPVPPPTVPVPPPTLPGTAVTFELRGVIQEIVGNDQLILQDSTVVTITIETVIKFENGATAFAVDQKIEGKAIQTNGQLIATKIKAK